MALVLEINKRTLFIKLTSLFPECEFLISDVEKLHPLICLRGVCHRNANCMDKLVRRVKYVFDTFKEAKLLILYFSYRDQPGSQRAGVFWRDLREPRYFVMNRTGWEKMKEIGIVYDWPIPDSIFLPSEDKLTRLSLSSGG